MKIRGRGKAANPWWNNELEDLKKKCIQLHHKLNNSKNTQISTAVAMQHSNAKRTYAAALKKASTEHFREFCAQQGKENVWSLTNRLIKDAPLHRPPMTLQYSGLYSDTSAGTAEALLQHFFPDDTVDSTREHLHRRNRNKHYLNTPKDEPFTEEEVLEALVTMNPNRAPGLDNLTSDICLAFTKKYSKFLTALYNACLRVGYFPKIWKKAYIKILPKPNKVETNELGSYRPIGLLPVFGKLLEKLFTKRLIYHAESNQLWSPKQYGFKEQTSTLDALRNAIETIEKEKRKKRQVICVSLDIKGAFDHAWWPALLNQLERVQTPSNIYRLIISYLTDRSASLNYADATATKATTRGCIQGSVCGPIFWNIIIDELLSMPLPEGCEIQAFADDILLIVSAKTVKELQLYANDALRLIYNWGKNVKLTFSDTKTYAMAFKSNAKQAELFLNGNRLIFVKEIKYLGVVIDDRLRFTNHAKYVVDKAQRVYKNLCRYVRPTWGVHADNVITIYKHVVEPTITYAASIWGKAIQFNYIRRLLRSFQRTFAIRAIRGFHTVSANSALALAGFTPLHLKIKETMQIESVKLSGVYDETLNVMLEQRTTPKNQLHPSERQSIRFESIASQQEADNTMDANATHIYTDGSKLETGACGSAFVVHKQDDDWTSRKFKLHDTCTVFQAEALAIDTALKWAQNELKTEKLVIYSDSRSCLEAIQNRSNPNPLIASIHQHLYLLRQRHRIDFYWVKSHIGIEGNERADEQAKEAANQGVDPVYTAFPLSYAIRQIRSQIFESWQQEYADDTTGSITKIFFPILEDAQLYRQLFGISFELTQLFTGHGFNKAYLKRFKIIDEDWCPCDQLTVQSMHHLLHDCPRFHSARQRHETFCAQYDIPAFNIKQISKYPSLITSFNEFVKKIIDNLKNFNASNIPT